MTPPGAGGPLHADEVAVDAASVRRAVAAQFPHWASLALRPVTPGGTDNVLLRLGDELVLRLPRRPADGSRLEAERRWLPVLGPALPLGVPEPVARGAPGPGLRRPWAVYRWIDGDPVTVDRLGSLEGTADILAALLTALWALDPAGAPGPGPGNGFRGAPLAPRHAAVTAALGELAPEIDVPPVRRAWEAALAAPVHLGAPRLLHGDLLPSNFVSRGRRLAAVLDFGCLGAGDPATDLMAAWTLLDPAGRRRLRRLLGTDDATWARARGWALAVAAVALPYYRTSHPVLAGIARRTLGQVVSDSPL